MNIREQLRTSQTRRAFLQGSTLGIGSIALGELQANEATKDPVSRTPVGGMKGLPHFPPKVKRIIYLFHRDSFLYNFLGFWGEFGGDFWRVFGGVVVYLYHIFGGFLGGILGDCFDIF